MTEADYKRNLKLRDDKNDALMRQVDRLNDVIKRQQAVNKRLRSAFKANPQDRWYLVYLQDEVRRLEQLNDDQTDIIEQYQRHYSRYGEFYHELDSKLGRKRVKL